MDWYLIRVSFYTFLSGDINPTLLTDLRLVSAMSKGQAIQKALEHIGITKSMVDDVECLNVE